MRIGVFTLFHPRDLIIGSTGTTALIVHTGDEQFVLEPSSGINSARITFVSNGILVSDGKHSATVDHVLVAGRQNNATSFELSIPGRIQRSYLGRLEVTHTDSALVPVVTMDLETAAASVVAAETTNDTPLESMKAQAIASRSYLIASHRRHRDFDFCDTTHCQFLRDAPDPNSKAALAAAATSGLVLIFQSRPFAAMYTRSCTGQTLTPSQVHLPTDTYPYYSVACSYCRAHPVRWSSKIPFADTSLLRANDEPERLKLVRRLGWNTIPSDSFTVRKQGGYVFVRGTGQGHGIGLCQAGAAAMARSGSDFRHILAHYFPNSGIEQVTNSESP